MTRINERLTQVTRELLIEIAAKAMAYRSVGDVHAISISGAERWTWFVGDATAFVDVYGYLFLQDGRPK